jgi:hypothetical protein
MKKNLLKVLAVVAFAMIAGYNVYQAHSETEGMSEFALANVEALAGSENEITCKEDPGDTCMVGTTPVTDWDEKEGWW